MVVVYRDSWSEIRNLGSLRPTAMAYREESDFEGVFKVKEKSNIDIESIKRG